MSRIRRCGRLALLLLLILFMIYIYRDSQESNSKVLHQNVQPINTYDDSLPLLEQEKAMKIIRLSSLPITSDTVYNNKNVQKEKQTIEQLRDNLSKILNISSKFQKENNNVFRNKLNMKMSDRFSTINRENEYAKDHLKSYEVAKQKTNEVKNILRANGDKDTSVSRELTDTHFLGEAHNKTTFHTDKKMIEIPRHQVHFGDTELILGSEQSDNEPPVFLHLENHIRNKSSDESSVCKPKRNVCFLKTHKCYSSTIQNILFRWGDNNNAIFVLPRSNRPYLGSPSLFRREFAMPSPEGKYNILANHARYSKQGMSEVMPSNSVYITVLRDPAQQFESIYNYYGLRSRYYVDFLTFIDNPKKYFMQPNLSNKISERNPMLFDLGLDARFLEADDNKVDEWIKNIDNDFQLVLISEYFLESIILLKHELCWTLQDVAYFKQNERSKSSVRKINPIQAEKIREWNGADWKLYNHFNKTLWKKIEEFGYEKMKNEIKLLENLNHELSRKCVGSTRDFGDPRMWYPAGVRVKSFVLKPQSKGIRLCSQLTRPELAYITLLRKQHMGKLIN